MERHETDHETFAALYRETEPLLLRIVANNIHAPDGLLEDACQVAWSRLWHDPEPVQQGYALGWLARTASRALMAMLRARSNEVSFEQALDDDELSERPDAAPSTERIVELRDRLAGLQDLGEREQRILWLSALGYDYTEIAAQTGDSLRTVQRLLSRGRQRARAAA